METRFDGLGPDGIVSVTDHGVDAGSGVIIRDGAGGRCYLTADELVAVAPILSRLAAAAGERCQHGQLVMCRDDEGGLLCTRPAGHGGKHYAEAANGTVRRWASR